MNGTTKNINSPKKNLIGKITEITFSFATNPMIIPAITPRTNLIIRVSPFFLFPYYHSLNYKILLLLTLYTLVKQKAIKKIKIINMNIFFKKRVYFFYFLFYNI